METISRKELKKIKDNDDITVVNVLAADSYRKGHIPGSINIPLDKLEKQAKKKLDKDKQIIVYCASPSCQASPKAAKMLEKMGYDAKDYEGGMSDWEEAGEEVCNESHDKKEEPKDDEPEVCEFC